MKMDVNQCIILIDVHIDSARVDLSNGVEEAATVIDDSVRRSSGSSTSEASAISIACFQQLRIDITGEKHGVIDDGSASEGSAIYITGKVECKDGDRN